MNAKMKIIVIIVPAIITAIAFVGFVAMGVIKTGINVGTNSVMSLPILNEKIITGQVRDFFPTANDVHDFAISDIDYVIQPEPNDKSIGDKKVESAIGKENTIIGELRNNGAVEYATRAYSDFGSDSIISIDVSIIKFNSTEGAERSFELIKQKNIDGQVLIGTNFSDVGKDKIANIASISPNCYAIRVNTFISKHDIHTCREHNIIYIINAGSAGDRTISTEEIKTFMNVISNKLT